MTRAVVTQPELVAEQEAEVTICVHNKVGLNVKKSEQNA